ncbi:MAG: GTP-binding protein [Pirellulaceae bacterium]
MEKDHLRQDISQLKDIEQKLTNGRVEIVLFGEISTGKSALVNALVGEEVAEVNVQGGWTKESKPINWKAESYVLPGIDNSEMVIVDTPGINEVGDSDHQTIAKLAAKRGDLIVFVTDSDLNEVEFSAIIALLAVHKPILIVLNKIDLYSDEDLQRLTKIIRDDRLKGLVPPENFVMTSADPREIEYVEVDANGREKSVWKKPEPIVSDLKARILQILERDGLALVALNAAVFAADKTDRIAKLRVELRNKRANQTIWSFAAVKALAVGLNPAILADVLGGAAVDISMIITLAKIYGLEMSWMNAQKLARSIGMSLGSMLLVDVVLGTIFTGLKGLTLGGTTPLTALPQGAAGGFGSYIVGQAAKYYFEHGASWGNEAPKSVVRRILEETDKDSVLEQLKDEIKKKLAFNSHSK